MHSFSTPCLGNDFRYSQAVGVTDANLLSNWLRGVRIYGLEPVTLCVAPVSITQRKTRKLTSSAKKLLPWSKWWVWYRISASQQNSNLSELKTWIGLKVAVSGFLITLIVYHTSELQNSIWLIVVGWTCMSLLSQICLIYLNIITCKLLIPLIIMHSPSELKHSESCR